MPAIRTVGETDDFLTIEGLGFPFGGPFPGNGDSYGTRATPKTDFHWDLFPDRTPTDPEDVPARFTRPATYQHGFDDAIGLRRVGGWSPVRVDKKGVWVQAQIDKHDEYYDALRQLIDEKKLGLSSGSIEHAVRFAKNGDWLDWPAWDMAFTPTPSNPWAQMAARTGEFMLRITRTTDKAGKPTGPPEGGKPRDEIAAEDFAGPDKSYPIVNQASVDDAASLIGKADNPDAVKAKIIEIAKRKGLSIPDAWQPRSAFRTASDDVACASAVQQQLAYLMGCETDEADQLAMLRDAFDAIGKFIEAESAEIGTPEDESVEMAMPPAFAFMSAFREGRRNNASDQKLIDTAHDAISALGATAHLGDNPPNDETHQEPSPERSADALNRKRERANAKAVRKALRRAEKLGADAGAEFGAQEATRLLS